MAYIIVAIRVFLAWVLLASAWSKRGSAWPDQLAAYQLLPEAVARRLAPVIPVGEAAVSVALLIAGTPGLVAGGMAFLVFGTVLSLAHAKGYAGSCGCSKSGRVSGLAALRGLGWGTLALAVGASSLAENPGATIPIAITLELGTVAGVVLSIRLLAWWERARRTGRTDAGAASQHVGVS